MTPPSRPEEDREQPFISHLIELRTRLLRMVLAVLGFCILLLPWANPIYTALASPLMRILPAGSSMIATEVAAPFLTPFKTTLIVSVLLAIPFLLYQIWAFVAPGLYKHEQRLVLPLVVSSTLLYFLGMAFAYFAVFPVVFGFFVATAPEGVAVMTDISKYLDFVLTLFFAFGIAFEVPVATVLLVWTGVVTPADLIAKRPYVIVGAFLVGAVLTPPDVLSQTMLAIPMWLLFEVGVYCSKLLLRYRDQGEAGSAPDEPPPHTGPTPKPPKPAAPSSPSPAAATAGETLVGAEIEPGHLQEPGRFVPLTPEQMETELAAIEAAEQAQTAPPHPELPDPLIEDPVMLKLRRIQELRARDDEAGARRLLYQVLEEGDADQRQVARNILNQLDTP